LTAAYAYAYTHAVTPLTLRLREARLAKRWSQAMLAKKARVRQATISLLESGKARKWDLAVLDRLARALGVSPRALLGTTRRR
jgi:transcriptional regulator with XRE-family HTH domain